ncbi:PREDICTED: uncharacterized protein LOC108770733 [Trachymyrmex cornetzi]|uniref:uncharacterized protein LOC108770733 n=1 Tax=Trachymyrmex cornetzi TaxID=471704 RepID=UPI00084F732F|nr:PREDICTED: uncharacterized protein LOC108770733 [Trachymyrmex cornetzi]
MSHFHKYRCDKDSIIHSNNLRVDLNINVLVDILLKDCTAVNYIEQKIKSINLPNVEDTHYIELIFGITIPCYFKIHNVKLKNLWNLKRTEDAVISNVGRIQNIQAGFGFSAVNFYCNYQLAITFIPFSGSILGTIDGLSIATKLIIDYDKACDVNLEYVKVKNGKVVLLEITGLGLFTGLVTNQLTCTMNTELPNKIEEITEDIRKTIEQQINNFIYENYSIEVRQS